MKKFFLEHGEIDDVLRLMSFMQKRIFVYVTTLITSSAVFAICLDILMAFVLKGITNAAIGKNIELLKENIKLAAVLFIITSILAPTSIYICIKCIKKTMAEIRLKVFDHLMKLPMQYFDSNHSGNIIFKTINDTNMMENMYFFPLFNLFMSVILGVGSIIFMFVLNWKIAVLLMILGILSILINNYLSKPLRSISDSIQSTMASLVEQLINILSGSHIIKIFNIYNKMSNVFEDKNRKACLLNLELSKKRALLESSNYTIGVFSFIGMVIIAVFMSIQNVDNLGTSIACISLQGGVTNMFLGIGKFVADFRGCLAGTKRVFELLEEPEELTICSHSSMEDSDVQNGIVVKEVKFAYTYGQNVIDGLSINIDSNQFVAIVGESGSGKSTLFKLLVGFYKPTSGCIYINGKLVESYPLKCLRELVSYVPQDAFLFNCSVIDNIKMGCGPTSYEEIIEAAKIADIHEYIMKLPDGYETNVGEFGSKFSGGQKQRIAIARAVLKKSPFIILDEATSALDLETEKNVLNGLKKLTNNHTIILITHRLSNVKYVDSISVIDSKKVEYGTN